MVCSLFQYCYFRQSKTYQLRQSLRITKFSINLTILSIIEYNTTLAEHTVCQAIFFTFQVDLSEPSQSSILPPQKPNRGKPMLSGVRIYVQEHFVYYCSNYSLEHCSKLLAKYQQMLTVSILPAMSTMSTTFTISTIITV